MMDLRKLDDMYFSMEKAMPKRKARPLFDAPDFTLEQKGELAQGRARKREPSRKPPKVKEPPPVPPITHKGPERDDQYERMAEFFRHESVRNWKSPIYIGVDTGQHGAFGFLFPELLDITTAVDIPITKTVRSGKTKAGNARYKVLFDEPLVWQYVKLWIPFRSRLVVCIEETQPRETDFGRTGHAMGYALGMWPLFLLSHGISVEKVLPGPWKQKMGLTGKDKEWSRLLAQRLFPSAPLFRKGDDGRAEALLVAEFFRRKRSK